MKFDKDKYKDAWVGLKIGLSSADIDMIISLLQGLKEEGHFHLTSGFEGYSKVGDIEIYFSEDGDDKLKFL